MTSLKKSQGDNIRTFEKDGHSIYAGKYRSYDRKDLGEIKSEESGLIIGRNGQTLDAIELIVNLMLNKDKNTRTKVSVDADKFHLKARRAASENGKGNRASG